ncbi:MAG: glycosyl transferase [Robiginitomaculum sp.]|nr:MAG: glycosyl transferase [Robiginitomaculum sp.]
MSHAVESTIEVFNNADPIPDSGLIMSILVPFYHDDPAQLIAAISAQACDGIELILYDDGTQSGQLHDQLRQVIVAANLPAQILTCTNNHGRSNARNRLIQAARGQYLLFLDADMLPGTEQFLSTWMAEIAANQPAVVFGGFSVLEASGDRAYDLHRALSVSSDCLDAEQRNKIPAKHVCTSNLLVRRDVLEVCTFDTEFVGWGWEDVEWAARVAEQFTITHIDNSAIHLGLENAETLINRFRDSAENYAIFVARHPVLAQQLPSYRTAKLAGKIPGLKLLRPVLRSLALDPWQVFPMKLRVLALKLWRAGWYAEKLA